MYGFHKTVPLLLLLYVFASTVTARTGQTCCKKFLKWDEKLDTFQWRPLGESCGENAIMWIKRKGKGKPNGDQEMCVNLDTYRDRFISMNERLSQNELKAAVSSCAQQREVAIITKDGRVKCDTWQWDYENRYDILYTPMMNEVPMPKNLSVATPSLAVWRRYLKMLQSFEYSAMRVYYGYTDNNWEKLAPAMFKLIATSAHAAADRSRPKTPAQKAPSRDTPSNDEDHTDLETEGAGDSSLEEFVKEEHKVVLTPPPPSPLPPLPTRRSAAANIASQ
ncbi:b9 [miniopterid betaherpesvirus 1]|uniref:B9 n=1 Tax=miniopterid betaherpesvirus 1 TaxID=3070189 RepID=I3VPZ0_9BETA|nr:b9 [miniopterid betaherpesvirus 1]AFK83834.1 b9 [miniopterid betaherpesvirus 1]